MFQKIKHELVCGWLWSGVVNVWIFILSMTISRITIKNITEFVPGILLSEVQAVIKSNKSPGIVAIIAEALRSREQEGLIIYIS